MRVRLFFWGMLTVTCIGVLLFAGWVSAHRTVPMVAQIDRVSTAAPGITTLHVRLTDLDGMPIDQAQVRPDARMTNMLMPAPESEVKSMGQGDYLARIQLSMAGSWEIRIVAHADGFVDFQRSLLLQVSQTNRHILAECPLL